MNNRKIQVILVVLAVAFLGSGCAQLKEKFVRKSKEEEVRPRRYRVVKEYDVHPTLDLYTKRYIYWKNWHRELLDVLGEANQKKTNVVINQDISNLRDMRNMLVDEKSDQLQVIIDEMTQIAQKLKTERVTGGNEIRVRRKLEALGREIKRDFSYTKMKGFIRDDFRKD